MADLLAHVLLSYAIFRVAGWVVDWLDEGWIAVGMVGSVLPDLERMSLLVTNESMRRLTGLPFDWDGIHTLAGVAVLVCIGTLLFDTRRHRVRALVLLGGGALSHVLVDVPQRYADGDTITNLYLFPLPPWRLPTPGLYVSADRWVVLVAAACALVVLAVDRSVVGDRS